MLVAAHRLGEERARAVLLAQVAARPPGPVEEAGGVRRRRPVGDGLLEPLRRRGVVARAGDRPTPHARWPRRRSGPAGKSSQQLPEVGQRVVVPRVLLVEVRLVDERLFRPRRSGEARDDGRVGGGCPRAARLLARDVVRRFRRRGGVGGHRLQLGQAVLLLVVGEQRAAEPRRDTTSASGGRRRPREEDAQGRRGVLVPLGLEQLQGARAVPRIPLLLASSGAGTRPGTSSAAPTARPPRWPGSRGRGGPRRSRPRAGRPSSPAPSRAGAAPSAPSPRRSRGLRSARRPPRPGARGERSSPRRAGAPRTGGARPARARRRRDRHPRPRQRRPAARGRGRGREGRDRPGACGSRCARPRAGPAPRRGARGRAAGARRPGARARRWRRPRRSAISCSAATAASGDPLPVAAWCSSFSPSSSGDGSSQ